MHPPGPGIAGLDGEMPLAALIEEASRELAICNACRYCEGLCPVFPALERRTVILEGDATQLANLCHDCRSCVDACMYSPPHEFGIDLPTVLTAVRLADYDRLVWPYRVPRPLRGRSGMVIGSLVALVIVVVIALLHAGVSGLTQGNGMAASPYELVPYPVLLVLMLGSAAYAVAILMLAGRTYWHTTATSSVQVSGRAVVLAAWQALTLRHMRGGGAECFYPDVEQPSAARRRLHELLVYGFGLCLVSTVAAAVEQDIIGTQPPYPWMSVPVITGVVGGVAMLIGCGGLVELKWRGRTSSVLPEMTIKDYGLLCALMFLALSGLVVLATRDSHVYGIALVIHLAALLEAFVMLPYSKLVHAVFRFLALVRDNAEVAGASD